MDEKPVPYDPMLIKRILQEYPHRKDIAALLTSERTSNSDTIVSSAISVFLLDFTSYQLLEIKKHEGLLDTLLWEPAQENVRRRNLWDDFCDFVIKHPIAVQKPSLPEPKTRTPSPFIKCISCGASLDSPDIRCGRCGNSVCQ